MEAPKMNELQIRLMAIAQCIEGVEVKGKDNWNRLMSVIRELEKFSADVAGKKLIDDVNA